MPYIKGTATSYEDLIAQLVVWVTDTAIHGDNAWELMRSEPWPRGTILKAKGLQGQDHCYIGLMALNIDSNSYANWYFTPANFTKYFVWSPYGLNLPLGRSFRLTGNGVVVDDSIYSISSANIFANSFKALVFGVFKQYAPGLDWDEQPGGLNIDPAGMGLKKGVLYLDGEPSRRFTLPLYPGTGYPGIGMNTDDPVEGKFTFWLKKDKSRITVITKNRMLFPDTEYWDMAQAGMLVPYHGRMQYPFPAVIAGSSSGAVSVGRLDSTFSPDNPVPLIDVQIDYGRHHWMMTRGMPTFPTMATDAPNSLSQIVLCLPDGIWQYFANQVQQIVPYVPRGEKDPVFIVDKPRKGPQISHYVTPTYTDLRGTEHLYQYPPLEDEIIYQLETLKLIQADSQRKNILGFLANLFWSSLPAQKYGEVVINGKKHVMLPNCWKERNWYYRTGLMGEYNPNDLLAKEIEIAQMTKQTNCLIRLED